MKFNAGDRVRATHDYTRHNMGSQSYIGMVYATDLGHREEYGVVIFEPESNMRYPCMTFAEDELQLIARAVYEKTADCI